MEQIIRNRPGTAPGKNRAVVAAASSAVVPVIDGARSTAQAERKEYASPQKTPSPKKKARPQSAVAPNRGGPAPGVRPQSTGAVNIFGSPPRSRSPSTPKSRSTPRSPTPPGTEAFPGEQFLATMPSPEDDFLTPGVPFSAVMAGETEVVGGASNKSVVRRQKEVEDDAFFAAIPDGWRRVRPASAPAGREEPVGSGGGAPAAGGHAAESRTSGPDGGPSRGLEEDKKSLRAAPRRLPPTKKARLLRFDMVRVDAKIKFSKDKIQNVGSIPHINPISERGCVGARAVDKTVLRASRSVRVSRAITFRPDDHLAATSGVFDGGFASSEVLSHQQRPASAPLLGKSNSAGAQLEKVLLAKKHNAGSSSTKEKAWADRMQLSSSQLRELQRPSCPASSGDTRTPETIRERLAQERLRPMTTTVRRELERMRREEVEQASVVGVQALLRRGGGVVGGGAGGANSPPGGGSGAATPVAGAGSSSAKELVPGTSAHANKPAGGGRADVPQRSVRVGSNQETPSKTSKTKSSERTKSQDDSPKSPKIDIKHGDPAVVAAQLQKRWFQFLDQLAEQEDQKERFARYSTYFAKIEANNVTKEQRAEFMLEISDHFRELVKHAPYILSQFFFSSAVAADEAIREQILDEEKRKLEGKTGDEDDGTDPSPDKAKPDESPKTPVRRRSSVMHSFMSANAGSATSITQKRYQKQKALEKALGRRRYLWCMGLSATSSLQYVVLAVCGMGGMWGNGRFGRMSWEGRNKRSRGGLGGAICGGGRIADSVTV